jgi:hypothetical protein
MPYKTWVAGEEVLAADFNAYLQEQVIATFPTAAARNTAITSPKEGMVTWVSDVNRLDVWDGTQWAPFMPTPSQFFLFAVEPLTTAAQTAGTITAGTPAFPYRVHLELTWRYWHTAPAMTYVRLPDFQAAIIDYPGQAVVNNVEMYGTAMVVSKDMNAGQPATFPIQAYTLNNGGGIRAGVAKVTIVAR